MRLETTAFRPEPERLHRVVSGSLQAAELVGNGIDANPSDPRTLRVGKTPAASQREAERLTTTDTFWKRLDERRHNRRLDLPKETKRKMQILRTNPPNRPTGPNPGLQFILKRPDAVSYGRRKLDCEKCSHRCKEQRKGAKAQGRKDPRSDPRFSLRLCDFAPLRLCVEKKSPE